MENLFAKFISNDEQLINEANEELKYKIECPEFIKDLFIFLGQALNSDSNPILIKSICIAIYNMITKNWKSGFPDVDLTQFIFNNLMDYIFVVPFDDRQFLSSSLFIFFHITEYSSLIMNACMGQINPDSIENVSTSIYIISRIIDICIFTKREEEAHQYYNMSIDLLFDIASQTFDYFKSNSSDQIDDSKKDEYEILTSLALSLVEYCTYVIQRPQIINDQYFKIVEVIVSLLQLNNLSFKLQTKISYFINSLISNLFLRKFNDDDDSISAIQEYFENNTLSVIFTSISTCLSSHDVNSLACAYLIKVIYHMTTQKWYLEEIISESFISQVVIPSCYIQVDDLQTYMDIPENFIPSYYPQKNVDPDLVSIRINVSELLNLISLHFDQSVDMILNCCTSNFLDSSDELQNQLDYESRLFVISCVIKYRSDDSSIFELLNNIVTTSDHPPFYYSTALFALKFMKINVDYLNMLSANIITKKEDVIITLFAVELFNTTFDPHNPNFGELLPDILNSLMELSSQVTSEEPANMLNKLIYQFPELIEENASDLISTLLMIWQKLVCETSEKDCKQYLTLIVSILQKMDQNSQIYSDKTDEICDFFMYAIQTFKDSYNLDDYFDVINALLEKADNPKPALYELIPFICEFIHDNFENIEPYIKHVIQFFINFVRKPNFFEFEEGKYASFLFEFGEMVLTYRNLPSSASNIYILYAAIIQVRKEQNIDLASIALNYFNEEITQPDFYSSSLVLLLSAVYVDPTSIIPMMNEQICSNISNNIQILKDTPENYIWFCIIGFCTLAMNGMENFYLDAVNTVKALIDIKRLEDDDDDLNTVGEIRSIFSFKDKTNQFFLPFDSLNPYDFFLKTSEKTHLYETLLSDEEWQSVYECATQLSIEF